jgi:hypothetical protein
MALSGAEWCLPWGERRAALPVLRTLVLVGDHESEEDFQFGLEHCADWAWRGRPATRLYFLYIWERLTDLDPPHVG